MNYQEFLASKRQDVAPDGAIVSRDILNPMLFEFQKDIVHLALKRGRCAIFADTGLGKGFIALEFLNMVHRLTNKPVLLLAPLAVSHQFLREAEKLGVKARVVSEDSQVGGGINITNYNKLHKFDVSQFVGVALDESSILKSFNGATRTYIIESFSRTPWKLALTATPAPNDFMELGNHAQFLGSMSHSEMLSKYFVHDGETTSEWRLKGHAKKDFWRWVSSWAITIRKPSDIGDYDDTSYNLPPLVYHHEVLPAKLSEIHAAGVLIPEFAKTLADQRDVRRATLLPRVARCADIARGTNGPVLIWCDLNAEGDLLEREIQGSIQVAGADSDDHKETLLAMFSEGKAKVLITKPSIAGFGLNWQHCHDMIFCGVTNSFESFYQSVRRCWRFGQAHPVNVHIVTSEFEGAVIENLKRKQLDAEHMAEAMVAATKGF
jgi:hypothetical protein